MTHIAWFLLVGVNWIFFFKKVFPQMQIKWISTIGKNTLPIFLMHGFFVKLIGKTGRVFLYSKYKNLGIAVVCTVGILALFGNRYFAKLFRLVGTTQWLVKIKKQIWQCAQKVVAEDLSTPDA